jgi:RNA polymerase sigma-70 factor (ECF subfamily)
MMAEHDSSSGGVGPELLGRLLDRHAAPLELYARQWCQCPEDVVQEAFIELAGQFPPPDEAISWLYRVVRNKAISALRSSRRRKRHESAAVGVRSMAFAPSPGDCVDADLAAAALESLAIEQREVVVARIWGGLSFQQIGQLVGVTDSSAHRRYEAGLLALRRKLRVPCPNQKTD